MKLLLLAEQSTPMQSRAQAKPVKRVKAKPVAEPMIVVKPEKAEQVVVPLFTPEEIQALNEQVERNRRLHIALKRIEARRIAPEKEAQVKNGQMEQAERDKRFNAALDEIRAHRKKRGKN